ncbi:hypothetical protein GL2_39920 [Microbulbifer sp. GL-2]|nr:hypothetical protein GL2_39920 [Microbulbifer sp. GL-2]
MELEGSIPEIVAKWIVSHWLFNKLLVRIKRERSINLNIGFCVEYSYGRVNTRGRRSGRPI